MQDSGFQNRKQDRRLSYNLDVCSGSANWPQRLYFLLCYEYDTMPPENMAIATVELSRVALPNITLRRPVAPQALPAPTVCWQ